MGEEELNERMRRDWESMYSVHEFYTIKHMVKIIEDERAPKIPVERVLR